MEKLSIVSLLFVKTHEKPEALNARLSPEFELESLALHKPEHGISVLARKESEEAGNTVKDVPAKLSNLLLVLDAIYDKRIAAAVIDDMVYVEETDASRCNTYSALCENGKVTFDHVPSSPYLKLAPIFCYFLINDNFAITKDVLNNLPINLDKVEDLKETSVDSIFELCDSFYYESQAQKTKGNISEKFECFDGLAPEMVKQSARVNSPTEIPALTNFGLPTVGLVTVEADREEVAHMESSIEEKMNLIKSGAYKIDYEWEDREAYVPDDSVLDSFVPSQSFFSMVNLISHELREVKTRMDDEGIFNYKAIKENYVNAQFIGRPGTGKTTIANALAATFGLPIRVVINSKHTEEDTFQGMTKVQEGGFKFVETPFLDAFKNGGIILLEEFNLTDPGVTMGVLGQAIEKPFILLEDGYKEIRRHPLCVIIATSNVGTQGSREPSEALTSRMPNVFLLDDPKQEEFLQILKKSNPDVDGAMCKKVYKAYNNVLNYLTSSSVNAEDVALSLCLRHCLAALKQISIGSTFKQALSNTIIGTIGIKDLDLAREVQANVIDTLPD